MEARKVQYRPEIDGLRAVAVLPVILFHAGFQTFSGGFVGVDVFFVISGYLITTIILHELDQGSFTIAGFYERRARRILPALLLVVFACIPFAWFVLYPRHFTEFAQSLVAVATFSSNVFFWKQQNYFGTAAELKPLLHTWSLAVEEQFYILFPLALLAFRRLWKPHLLPLLFVLLVLGLALSHWASYSKPSAAFFFLPTRGWELLVGAVVAAYLLNFEPKVAPPLRQVLGATGLLMILAAVLMYDKSTPFPGGYALLPTLGAALVILFGTQGTLAFRVLCAKPMVVIGLISYSAYLWHQPLLAFDRHADMGMPILMVALSLILAFLSWKYVELPFRGKSPALNLGRKGTLMASCALLVLLAATGAALWKSGAQENWTLGTKLGYTAEQIARHRTYMSQLDYVFSKHRLDNGQCVFWSERLEHVLDRVRGCAAKLGGGTLYVGDSHASNFHNVAYHASGNSGFRVTIGKGGCRFDTPGCIYDQLETFLKANPGLFSTIVYHQAGSHLLLDKRGRSDSQAAFKEPASVRIDTEEIELITRHLDRLGALVSKVVFLGPYYEPRLDFGQLEHLASHFVPPETTDELFTRLDRHLTSEYTEGALSARFEYVSLLALQPKALRALVHADCFVYQDLDHLSLCGERLFGEAIRKAGPDVLEKLGLR